MKRKVALPYGMVVFLTGIANTRGIGCQWKINTNHLVDANFKEDVWYGDRGI